MNKHLLKVWLLLLATGASPVIHAHSVWIEDTADGRLVVRFGEAGKFETSPGYLDSLSHPKAWTPAVEGRPPSLDVRKNYDHFHVVGAKPDTAALGETVFPVMGKAGAPGSQPFFYVRWQPAGAPVPEKPALTIDILPTGRPNEFQVYFRGQPLPEARLVHHGRGEDETIKLTADAEGRVTITPHSGLNLLTANHRESINGFAGGSEYSRLSHNVALTWREP